MAPREPTVWIPNLLDNGDQDMSSALQDASKIKTALANARSGSGTLTDLGLAHDLAVKHRLPDCSAELRRHIQARLTPRPGWTLGKDLAVSAVAGIATHFLLRRIG
jgi:hypothetical protein